MEISISYYGIEISVPKEVADFLEEDRKRQEAERKRSSRHLSKSDFEMVLATYVQGPKDPVFEEVARNLSLERLRTAVAALSPDEQQLISLRFEEEMTLEAIGTVYGVTKMAISKRLRTLYAKLRVSLTGEALKIFSAKRFTKPAPLSYLLKAIMPITYQTGGMPMKTAYTSIEQLPVTLSAPEVARYLGISRAGAYNLLRSKGFPTLHIGNRLVVPKDKLLAWVDKQTENVSA